MQGPAPELRRTPLLGIWVNKGKCGLEREYIVPGWSDLDERLAAFMGLVRILPLSENLGRVYSSMASSGRPYGSIRGFENIPTAGSVSAPVSLSFSSTCACAVGSTKNV
jgi:hypothetical protein